MNRPRPRKLINVIKTSNSSTEEIPINCEFEEKEKVQAVSVPVPVPTFKNNFNFKATKPTIVSKIPSVPQFKSVPSSPTTTNDFVVESKRNITENPSSSLSINKHPSNVVNSIKKSPVPPPPNYFSNSNSPKSSSSPSTSPALSAKSSGENFLDAADRAADFIGGAFFVQTK